MHAFPFLVNFSINFGHYTLKISCLYRGQFLKPYVYIFNHKEGRHMLKKTITMPLLDFLKI